MADVHDSNPNLPRRPGRPLDEVASLVLDVLIAHEGEMHSEPGELLKQIARETECDYFAVATAVRMLEDIGFITVERTVSGTGHRGNRVVALHLS